MLAALPNKVSILHRILSKLGVNRAVGWTLLTQILRLFTGPVTMLLMLRFLTPELQGYCYAFSGILAVSVFLEMGFSQNILQFASHEFSKLSLTKERWLQGDSSAISRLTSLARLSFKYYATAAILFALITSFGGAWFFRTSQDVGVNWQMPWTLACIISAISLAINPCWALLEGCNQIAEIGRYRFWSTLFAFMLTICGYVAGLGLFVGPVVGSLGLIVSGGYLLLRWRNFFKIFLLEPKLGSISWKKEIWPFQWRIAISWISGYLLFSIVVPIIFRQIGPVAAGKYGFTMTLVTTVANAAGSWSTTKLPQYGMLVAQQNWSELRTLWRKSTLYSLMVAVLGSAVLLISLQILCPHFPQLNERYSGAIVAVLLCFCMVAQNLINSCAYLLRAFKKEPYMWPSVIGAIINTVLIWILTDLWGIIGSAVGFTLCYIIIFYPLYYIFKKNQLKFMNGFDLLK